MNKKTIKRLFTYLRGSSALVVLSVVLGIFFGAATVAIPFFAGKAIDNLGNIEKLIRYLVVIICLIAAAAVLQFALIRMNNRIAYAIGLNLRNEPMQRCTG